MPKQWENRAALGAALMVVLLPVLTLTGDSLGVRLPTVILQAALAIEIVGVLFALALIVLPHRIWRFGHRESDAIHAISMPSVQMVISKPPELTTSLAAVNLVIQNHTDRPIRCRILNCTWTILELDLMPTVPQSGPIDFVIPARGNSPIRSAAIENLPRDKPRFDALLEWSAAYGPVYGKYEVRWVRQLRVSFGLGATDMPLTADQVPETHAAIKPTNDPV